MLLTVVSRALVTQAVLCDTPLMSLVWVAVGRAAAMSSTAAARLVRAARVMPHIAIDAILLLHGNTITFISLPLVPIIVIVVIIELVIIIILPVVRRSGLAHCSLP